MPVQVTLYRCIQDSQELGSNDEHMVSRVFFSVDADGKAYEGYIDIKQIVGSDYESGPIEVSGPSGYPGPLDYQVFRGEVEQYYRSLVGSTAQAIRVAHGARGNRFYNNEFDRRHTFTMDPKASGGAW